MTAEEARVISLHHSKRMHKIYKSIEEAAKKGDNDLCLNTAEATAIEIDVLRKNGYIVAYETSEIDGGQFVLIKW